MRRTQEVNDLTELEARIDFAFRLKRNQDDPDADSSQRCNHRVHRQKRIARFGRRSLFEVLPLLRNLQKLVTTSRPLGADDYMLQSEEKTDPNVSREPEALGSASIETAFDDAAMSLDNALIAS